jgi:formylglycine-generating enzyme
MRWLALIVAALGCLIASAAAAQSKPGDSFRDCPHCPEMVVIPAGSNVVGSTPQDLEDVWAALFRSHEVPQFTVRIARPFAIGRFEVTRAQWERFATETSYPTHNGCAFHDPKTDIWIKEIAGLSWRNPGYYQTDDHPATCLTWADGKAYAAWLSKKTGQRYRLPSEAEWEYAARGGTTTPRYWQMGAGTESICAYAQILTTETVKVIGPTKHFYGHDDQPGALACGSPHAFTRPVGSLKPNPFGLHDMLGNVVELTEDCFAPNHQGAPTDGSARTQADCKFHTARGGGMFSMPMLARSANRGGAPRDLHHSSQGFRLVRELR